MDIFTVKIEDFQNLVVSINWIAAIALLILIFLASKFISWIYKKTIFKTIQIDEAVIGIGNSSVTIKYDGCIKEIAYKIWVELTTRKIGLEFEEDYDVISEVYASWYNAFQIIRSLLGEVPADRISSAKGLVEVTTKVLNNGFQFKANKDIFFAGQMTGVEGYVESSASGIYAAINMLRLLKGEELVTFPRETIMGSMANYISVYHDEFVPMNANYGIVPELDFHCKKKERKEFYGNRAVNKMKEVISLWKILT